MLAWPSDLHSSSLFLYLYTCLFVCLYSACCEAYAVSYKLLLLAAVCQRAMAHSPQADPMMGPMLGPGAAQAHQKMSQRPAQPTTPLRPCCRGAMAAGCCYAAPPAWAVPAAASHQVKAVSSASTGIAARCQTHSTSLEAFRSSLHQI